MDKAVAGSRVVILGASNKPDRYSYLAFKLLQEKRFVPVPVHPALKEIEGVSVFSSLEEVEKPIDTVTLYVNPTIIEQSISAVIKLAPRRVIMNPGTESSTAAAAFEQAGIEVVTACTLVLLKTGQF